MNLSSDDRRAPRSTLDNELEGKSAASAGRVELLEQLEQIGRRREDGLRRRLTCPPHDGTSQRSRRKRKQEKGGDGNVVEGLDVGQEGYASGGRITEICDTANGRRKGARRREGAGEGQTEGRV